VYREVRSFSHSHNCPPAYIACILAGGYDAIWLLVIFKDKTFGSLEEVEEAWRAFPEESDFPEMAKLPDISVSPLSAYENRGIGVRVETVEDVAGLQKVLEKSRNPPV
jgi:hypothetical protein